MLPGNSFIDPITAAAALFLPRPDVLFCGDSMRIAGEAVFTGDFFLVLTAFRPLPVISSSFFTFAGDLIDVATPFLRLARFAGDTLLSDFAAGLVTGDFTSRVVFFAEAPLRLTRFTGDVVAINSVAWDFTTLLAGEAIFVGDALDAAPLRRETRFMGDAGLLIAFLEGDFSAVFTGDATFAGDLVGVFAAAPLRRLIRFGGDAKAATFSAGDFEVNVFIGDFLADFFAAPPFFRLTDFGGDAGATAS